jgi:hypothetical protein
MEAQILWKRACLRWRFDVQHPCQQMLRYRRNAAQSKLAHSGGGELYSLSRHHLIADDVLCEILS